MKKSTLSFKLMTLLLCGFLTVSCGDDDEEQLPSLENQLEYFDTIYDLTLGASLDAGATGFSTTNTHHVQAFLLTDVNQNTGAEKVNLVFYTYSLGASSFKTGRFEYANFAGLTLAQRTATYGNKSFFLNSYLVVDLNNDKQLDNTEVVRIASGSVNISGTAPNYTLDCHVVLENGQTLRAQYSGEFIDITNDVVDEDAKANMRKAPSGISSALRAPKSLRVE
ncbi:hypothetical protein [Rufibacter sp. XAAS-G3-1]|uniref:hypothetical protein n=1 Tax=Rufibacter sp. XAAS-G3-1 TaxID=2729134 RepID=UPI0015E76D72|nr:hypothetical protein [Rufibacter sp. XAAS-G3-1]